MDGFLAPLFHPGADNDVLVFLEHLPQYHLVACRIGEYNVESDSSSPLCLELVYKVCVYGFGKGKYSEVGLLELIQALGVYFDDRYLVGRSGVIVPVEKKRIEVESDRPLE